MTVPIEVLTDAGDGTLQAHVRDHAAAEEEILAAYDALAGSGPPHVHYLVSLITDDERRHHRILVEMASRIVADTGRDPLGPVVPAEAYDDGDTERIIGATTRFLDLERDDLRDLRRLARTVRSQADNTLFPLLVKLMELDTAKHIAILEFLRRAAQRAGPQGPPNPEQGPSGPV